MTMMSRKIMKMWNKRIRVMVFDSRTAGVRVTMSRKITKMRNKRLLGVVRKNYSIVNCQF